MWRSVLSFLGIAAPVSAGTKLRNECMSRLAELDLHIAEARRIEVRSHIREARAAANPVRQEMRHLKRKRRDALDAAEHGDITPSDLAEAMKDLAKRLDQKR